MAIFAPWDARGAGVAADPQLVWFSYHLTLDVPPPDPLATDRGLFLGDSVDRLLELYPEVTVYDGAYGGRFYRFSDDIIGPNGILGRSDPEYVLSFEAGDYPCDLLR